MNLSRCENGHFYDKEKYASCPHCAQGAGGNESMTTVFEENGEGNAMGVTQSLQQPPMQKETGGAGAVEMTEQVTPGAGAFVQPPAQGVMPLNDQIHTPPMMMDQGWDPKPVAGTDITQPAQPPQPPVGTVVPNPIEEDDDHTEAFYGDLFTVTQPLSETPETQTRSQAPRVTHSNAPCVGWLVALSGVHLGQDFRLKPGKNFLGRDRSMDVVLDGDKSVSRNKHAIIVYEPKQHLYLVQPGESSELVYLNDEVVLSPVKLKIYDKITIGEVNLLFVPLCGEQFNWSQMLEKK